MGEKEGKLTPLSGGKVLGEGYLSNLRSTIWDSYYNRYYYNNSITLHLYYYNNKLYYGSKVYYN